MKIWYKGRKLSGLNVSAPYLSQQYDFPRGTPVSVQDDDGALLVDMYPAIFGVIADHQEQDTKQDSKEKAEDNDFTFDIDEETDSYLCPLCEKSYKVNKGRGRYALIAHLEEKHAEGWANLLQDPSED